MVEWFAIGDRVTWRKPEGDPGQWKLWECEIQGLVDEYTEGPFLVCSCELARRLHAGLLFRPHPQLLTISLNHKRIDMKFSGVLFRKAS